MNADKKSKEAASATNALKVFESNIGVSCSIQELIENIAIEVFTERLNPDDSLPEILCGLIETFTSEEKRLLEINNAKAAESAEVKSLKLFWRKRFSSWAGIH